MSDVSAETASDAADVRAFIVADLARTQGPWRKKSPAQRFALLFVPAFLVVGAGFLLLDGGRGVTAQVVVAGAASLVALLATALAPTKPAASERMSQLAFAVAVVAFIAEVTRMEDGGPHDVGASCLILVAVLTVAAAVVTALALFASRLPLRLWHRIGLSTAATLGAASALWHHCPSVDKVHVAVAHTLAPVVLIAVVVVAMGRLQR